jgi:hypothetical protein
LKRVAVICAVALAGIAIGWLGRIGLRHEVSLPTPGGPQENAKTPELWYGPRRSVSPAAVAAKPDSARYSPAAITNPPAEASTNWENQVRTLLASNLPESEVARKLLELFPTLPDEGQAQVARQLSATLSDADYPMLAQYLMDPFVSEAVQDVLLTGLLDRSDTIKAPLLLAVAMDQEHPKAEDARLYLELLIGQDLGDDPAAWPGTVQLWLEDSRR